jgi:hypothetical protein
MEYVILSYSLILHILKNFAHEFIETFFVGKI